MLGASVSLQPGERAVTLQVSPDKAEKWINTIQECLSMDRCDPGEASKLVGRLSFGVTVAEDKIGRAYIRPFHAQAHAPWQDSQLSPMLRDAMAWWLEYLLIKQPTMHYAVGAPRQQLTTWTDASGQDRWLAAVIHCDGRWAWTRMQTPESLWDQLIDREDHQIGYQELLGV